MCEDIVPGRVRHPPPHNIHANPHPPPGGEGVGGGRIFIDTASHRGRIKTEGKAKVVASVWGEEFIQIFAALPVLSRTILNNRMNFFQIILVQFTLLFII